MLGCNRVTGRHTADNIMVWFEEIVSEYDIREKIKHVITDSASNIKKAFLTLPGYEDNTSDDKDEDSEEYDDLPSVSPSAESSVDPSEFLFEHHSCFAHVLQLVVKDGLAKAGQIATVIKKCSNLVSFVRRSTVASDAETRLQADNVTRWNSQLKMIRSVLAVSEDKLEGLENAPKLTSHEKNILRDIMEILTPFEEATDFV